MKKYTLSLLIAGLLVGSNIGFLYIGSVIQMNADQAQFNQYIAKLQQSGQAYGFNGRGNVTYSVELILIAYHHLDLEPRQNLIDQGWVPDCLKWCFQGIHYFHDPTTLITSQGRGIIQCLVFGATSTDTCTASNFAKYMGWSVNTNVPANADTYAGGASIPCSSTNLIVDANGLRDVAGTVTPAANGVTVATVVSKTFTITGTYTAVQVACLLSGTGTNADSGTNPLLVGESTFGPDSFVNGDQLTGTWTITIS